MEYIKCSQHNRVSYMTCLEIDCKREMICHFCIKEQHSNHRTIIVEDFLKQLDTMVPNKNTLWEKDQLIKEYQKLDSQIIEFLQQNNKHLDQNVQQITKEIKNDPQLLQKTLIELNQKFPGILQENFQYENKNDKQFEQFIDFCQQDKKTIQSLLQVDDYDVNHQNDIINSTSESKNYNNSKNPSSPHVPIYINSQVVSDAESDKSISELLLMNRPP